MLSVIYHINRIKGEKLDIIISYDEIEWPLGKKKFFKGLLSFLLIFLLLPVLLRYS